jgi:protein tyrosine phosphatase (PTP) superfamily phosphohydrolase (DUF442 family)
MYTLWHALVYRGVTMTAPIDALGGVVNVCLLAPTVVTGGQPSASNLAAFAAAGGGIVLDLRDPMEPRPLDEPQAARAAGLDYVNIPVTIASQNDTTLERILEVVRDAGERTVFVHCGSGDRVGGALIPWLILDLGFEEEDAINQAMRIGLRSADLLQWALDYAKRRQTSA